jgi:hypothetical protein
MPQLLPVIPPAPISCLPRLDPFVPRRRGESGAKFVLFLLSLIGLPAPLAAQNRGDLQVAARVLETQPSRLALVQGIAAARRAPASTPQSLASIQIEPGVTETKRLAVGRRPRAVVTISFLRN